jgi:hypothetical protein
VDSLSKAIIASTVVLIVGFSTAVSKTGSGKPAPRKKADPGEGPAIMWREPTDIATRDLYYGPGGKSHEPHGTFTYQSLDSQGSNPKIDVLDENGVKWRVKIGKESRSETAASRLIWATGYFANEDYYLPELQVQNMPKLYWRGAPIGSNGKVRSVRLKRHLKDEKKLGFWSWSDNPFKDKREWYGLQVLMAVLNNWDLKDDNNSVYQVRNPTTEQHYMVSDVGASFGTRGWTWAPKGNLNAYTHSPWIKSVSDGHVDFNVPGTPGWEHLINFPESVPHMKMRWIGRGIPAADARWMGQLLAKLSPNQIRDAFRASGYTPEEVEGYSQALEGRIAELTKL